MIEKLKCDKCGSDKGSNVVFTRQASDGVLRVRVCFGCHQQFTTTEMCDSTIEMITKKAVPKSPKIQKTA
jgi:transcriptional regulator NrdR family protein